MPMGESTTNFNIDELISSYIDKQIRDPQTERKVEELLKQDENLRKKYQSELLTKTLLKTRLGNVEVPNPTFRKITGVIDGLIADAEKKHEALEELHADAHPIAISSSFGEYLRRILSVPIRIGSVPVPRYAAAFVVLLMVVATGVYVNQSTHGSPSNERLIVGSEKNIMKQAIENFHKLVNGDIKPAIESKNTEDVKTYLTDNAGFPVYVPDISDYSLQGALCNEYNGQKLAHLIYKSGDDMIYIYQTHSKCLEHKDLEIPDEVKGEITSHKYFMCDQVDKQNCTLTIWYKDKLVCASVTNVPKQKMHTMFASFK